MLHLIFAIWAVLNVVCFGDFNNISFYEQKNCNNSLDNGVLTMDCVIQNNGIWDLQTFRDWTLKLDNISSISVSINCYHDGNVVLQNPIRAKGLEKLTITNCSIYNYHMYNFSEAVINLPDTLEEFVVDNCIQIVDVAHIIKRLRKDYDEKVNTFYPCHMSPTLRRYTDRNERVFYVNIHASKDYQESDKENAILNRPVCEYRYLKYYEKTNTRVSNQNMKYLVHDSRFPALEVLNISNLGLTEIPKQFYENEWWVFFRNLKIIDISYNNFESIDFKYPKPSNYRTTLTVNLTYNNISHITRHNLQNIKSFYPNIINLRNNPLKCSCDLVKMMEFFKSESDQKWTSAYAYLNDTKCIGQSSEKSMYKLSALNEADLCLLRRVDEGDLDTTHFYLPLFLALGISLLCILIVFIMIRFRTEIRILFHTRISGVIPMNGSSSPSSSKPIKAVSKDFDAFVSYSSRDEQWVLNVLCKRLESSPLNFSLCLHHKHFVPGAYIADNIIESIEKSRHTIMVLSNNFLNSEWCLLEFRKAFHQSLLEGSHLIIILLDDTLCLDTTPDLKHCLNTRTYLKVSETLFWDKLVYSLSNRYNVGKHDKGALSRDNSQDSSTTTSLSIEESTLFLP